MKIMNLDERQRYCWLAANRFTLLIVGLVWIGLIGWDLWQGHIPVFLILMVPFFALVRFISYRLYLRRLG